MSALNPKASQHVCVVQAVEMGEGIWRTQVEGRVISCEPHPTGSWFAHGKGRRLWLRRLRLEKADGEIVDLVLDRGSEVTLIEDAPPGDSPG